MSFIPGASSTPSTFPDGFSLSAGSVTNATLRWSSPTTGLYEPGTNQIGFTNAGVQTFLMSAAGAVTIGPSAFVGAHVINGAHLSIRNSGSNGGYIEGQQAGVPQWFIGKHPYNNFTGNNVGIGSVVAGVGLEFASANVLCGAVSAAGAWAFGPAPSAGANLEHIFQSQVQTQLSIRSLTGNSSILNFQQGSTNRLQIRHNPGVNRAELLVGNPATLVAAEISPTGAWTLGDGTNNTASHVFRANTTNEWVVRVQNLSNSNPYGQAITFTAAAPNDTTRLFFECADNVGVRATIRSNGGIANFSANNVNLSDARLKEAIEPAPSYLAKLLQVEVVNYKFKDQTHDDFNLGVIAQQLDSVCPELVDKDGFGTTPADGIPLMSVYQTDLQYALLKALQELSAKVDAQAAELEILKGLN